MLATLCYLCTTVLKHIRLPRGACDTCGKMLCGKEMLLITHPSFRTSMLNIQFCNEECRCKAGKKHSVIEKLQFSLEKTDDHPHFLQKMSFSKIKAMICFLLAYGDFILGIDNQYPFDMSKQVEICNKISGLDILQKLYETTRTRENRIDYSNFLNDAVICLGICPNYKLSALEDLK